MIARDDEGIDVTCVDDDPFASRLATLNVALRVKFGRLDVCFLARDCWFAVGARAWPVSLTVETTVRIFARAAGAGGGGRAFGSAFVGRAVLPVENVDRTIIGVNCSERRPSAQQRDDDQYM